MYYEDQTERKNIDKNDTKAVRRLIQNDKRRQKAIYGFLKQQLFEDPERLKKTSWVIFDEVHFLDDIERGTVWEEAIMFSPEHVRVHHGVRAAPPERSRAAPLHGPHRRDRAEARERVHRVSSLRQLAVTAVPASRAAFSF